MRKQQEIPKRFIDYNESENKKEYTNVIEDSVNRWLYYLKLSLDLDREIKRLNQKLCEFKKVPSLKADDWEKCKFKHFIMN